VLYRPPVKNTTWLLWGGPFVLLAVGLMLLIVRLRKISGQAGTEAELSDNEHQQAVQLLAKREDVFK
jgi:cytochrome c-type biogenesis protein CcmH